MHHHVKGCQCDLQRVQYPVEVFRTCEIVGEIVWNYGPGVAVPTQPFQQGREPTPVLEQDTWCFTEVTAESASVKSGVLGSREEVMYAMAKLVKQGD